MNKIDTARSSSIYGNISLKENVRDLQNPNGIQRFAKTNQGSSYSLESQDYAALVQNTNPTPKFNLPCHKSKVSSSKKYNQISKESSLNAAPHNKTAKN